MNKRMSRSVIGLALLASVTAACSDDDDEAATTTDAPAATDAPASTDAPADTDAAADTDAPAAAGTDAPAAAGSEFTIEGSAFPEGFVATVGEPFTVSNVDPAEHTVTSDDFSTFVGAGSTESLTVDAAGEYEIRCEIHPNMTGTITVE
jgi:plastocyanin